MPVPPSVLPAPVNPRHAAAFVRVVEAGGITAAARVLGVPKSAVSAAVAALEASLGVRLLHRSSRVVVPTEAGRAFYAQASVGLEALEAAGAAAINSQREIRGPIRISAPVETGTMLLEPIISRFLARHPEVTVEVVLTSRAVDLVAEGVDLALRGGPVHDSSLVGRLVGRADSGIFASPDFFGRRTEPEHEGALAGMAAVLHGNQSSTWALTGPRGAVAVHVYPRLRADHFAFAREAVIHGVGLGLFPLVLCERQVREGALVRVLPEVGIRGTTFHLVHAAGRFLPARVAALRDALVEGLAAGPLVQEPSDQGRGVSLSTV